MPLPVNLRHLEARNLHLAGTLPVKELDLDVHDEAIRAEEPLHYELEVQKVEQAILLQGTLDLVLKCECVRCLKSFDHRLTLGHWTRLLPLEGEEKVQIINDCVDLTPFLREDILLEFPQHPLCEPECPGLLHGRMHRQKKSAGPGQLEHDSSAWAELDKLKL